MTCVFRCLSWPWSLKVWDLFGSTESKLYHLYHPADIRVQRRQFVEAHPQRHEEGSGTEVRLTVEGSCFWVSGPCNAFDSKMWCWTWDLSFPGLFVEYILYSYQCRFIAVKNNIDSPFSELISKLMISRGSSYKMRLKDLSVDKHFPIFSYLFLK